MENPRPGGINVGDEWEYRGYVDGGPPYGATSLSSAIFEYDNFTAAMFGGRDILPLELTLGVFRTTKGDIEKRVVGSIRFESCGRRKY